MNLNAVHFGEGPTTETPKAGTVEDWVYIKMTDDTHPMHTHLVTFRYPGQVRAARECDGARFEKRAAGTPTTIPVEYVRAYLRELRRMVKRDVPRAKAMILGLLDGDMVLTPGTATGPAQVTGRLSPSGLLGVSIHSLRG